MIPISWLIAAKVPVSLKVFPLNLKTTPSVGMIDSIPPIPSSLFSSFSTFSILVRSPFFLILPASVLIWLCNLAFSASGLAATKLEAFFKTSAPNSKNRFSKGKMFSLYFLFLWPSKSLTALFCSGVNSFFNAVNLSVFLSK